MSRTIDEKVVEMRFDNKQFEHNVRNTMSTLERLKQKLNLTGASKGLENIDSAAKKVNFMGLNNAVETISVSFSKLEIMGITALTRLTNAAIDAGFKIGKALTIDPIKTGFSEYETQINAVQTILANTESKGTTLQQVNRALDELNTYADKTIYNFTEMTKNIGTFTAAGVDLNTSVSAIQGIANLAAVSGSTSQQASTAMYQLSQALSAGTVKLMDWNSVVNAGMGGQVFQDALKETARVHGINIDAMIKKEGSFRETLQTGWLSSEILTDTLEKFTMAAEEGTEEWETYKKALKDKGYTEEQAKSILKMANTATNAATKVKTFTQLWDTLKESAQSGWTQTWEIIVGDFGEAKEFLTTISDTIGGILGASADARNKLLSGGLSTGWKQLMGAGIADEAGYKETLEKVAKETGFEFDKLIKETEEKGGTFEDALQKALSDGSISSDMLSKSVGILSEKMQGMSAKEREAAGYTKEHINQIKKLDEGLKNGSVSMDDFVKKMKRPSGRENLIEALSNSFTGLMNILKPIKEAWREVFPAMQSEQLYNITVKIKELTASFAKFTEKYAPSIKSAFKGVFSVIGVGVDIFKTLASGMITLLSNISYFAGKLLSATGYLGDWLTNVSSSIKETNAFGKAIEKLVGFLQSGIDAIKDFIDVYAGGFFGILYSTIGFISKLGSNIGKAFANSLREGDFLSVMNIFNSGIFSSILLGFNKFTKSLSGPIENISDILDSLKGTLESYQRDIQANTLFKIASAVGILAASITILSMIKPENLGTAITAITTLFAELMGSVFIFGKIAPGMKGMASAILSMQSIAFALLILSAALKIISTIKWEDMKTALFGMATAMLEVFTFMFFMSKLKVGSVSGMLGITTSLVILASALKILSTIKWEDMKTALAALGGALLELLAFMGLMKLFKAGSPAGMIAITTSLVILAGSLKILATMSWDDIKRTLTVMGLALLELLTFMGLMKLFKAGSPAGMIGMATSLVILGGALKILGTMNWDEIKNALAALGGALLEILIFMGLMTKFNGGASAGALFVISASLVLLAGSLKILGSMNIDSIKKSLGTLAAVLAIMGVAALLLKPLIPVIISLAGSLALFGVAALALGVGLTLIATGITAFAVAISAGATSIVAGLGSILLGILGLIPEIGKIIDATIVVLCKAIFGNIGLIVSTLIALLDEVLKALATHTPSIINSLMTFLIGLIDGIAEHLPELIVSAVNLIGAFFKGVSDALGSIDVNTLLKGIIGVGLLTGLMYALASITAIVPAAMSGILSLGLLITELTLVLAAIGGLAQIPGLSWLIEEGGNFLQKVGTAIGQFIGGIAGGVLQGVTSSFPQMGTDLSQFMINATPFITGAKLIDSSVLEGVKALAETVLVLTAANILDGLTSWFTGGTSFVDFGKQLAAFGPYMAQYASSIAGINPDVVVASANAAKALSEMANNLPNSGGVAGWFAGENDMETFGSELVIFGKKLKEYSEAVVGVNVEAINASVTATKALSEMASAIPNMGGIVSWFTGDNDLAGFGKNLLSFGKNLKKYSEEISGLDTASISASTMEFEKIVNMAKGMQGVDFECLEGFGKSLKNMGKNSVDKFVESFKEGTLKASNGFKELLDKVIENAEKKYEKFIKLGNEVIKKFTKGISDEKSKPKDEFKKTTDEIIKNIRDKYNDFKSAGDHVVSGFAAGISENTFKAQASAIAMAEAALAAARAALLIKSPSRAFYEVGDFAGLGFVNALTDSGASAYDAGYTMAELAKDGLSNAITKVSDLINNGIDTQPTIRPVLDLTDVESGAGYLSSMFNGNSIGVMSNLNAISSGMNSRGQNGTNNDVVSAIDKLRKDLGNISGDTYNVNGVTYDDGSNIATAVKDIVRAVKMERRK